MSHKKQRLNRLAREVIAPLPIKPLTAATVVSEESALAIASRVIEELTLENDHLRRDAAVLYNLMRAQQDSARDHRKNKEAVISVMRDRSAWARIRHLTGRLPIHESNVPAKKGRHL